MVILKRHLETVERLILAKVCQTLENNGRVRDINKSTFLLKNLKYYDII